MPPSHLPLCLSIWSIFRHPNESNEYVLRLKWVLRTHELRYLDYRELSTAMGYKHLKTTFWLGCRSEHDFMWDFWWILAMSCELPPKMERCKYLQPPNSSNMSSAPPWFAQPKIEVSNIWVIHMESWSFPKIGLRVPQIHVSVAEMVWLCQILNDLGYPYFRKPPHFVTLFALEKPDRVLLAGPPLAYYHQKHKR